MWKYISDIILKNRLVIIGFLFVYILFMGYKAQQVKLSYSIAQLVPIDHQISIDYNSFLKKYGEQNIFVIAIEDSQLTSSVSHINNFIELTQEIEIIDGVNNLVSFTNLPILTKDLDSNKFILDSWVPDSVLSKKQLKECIDIFNKQKFYKDLFNTKSNKTTIVLISLDEEIIKSANRTNLIFTIKNLVDIYCHDYNATAYYSGLPYIRTVDSLKVKKEILFFIFLTIIITALILYIFFRSYKATISSMIVVISGVISSFGTISLFGYEISPLIALVPPVLIVIGIPNCIFLINKFHNEFKNHNSKKQALQVMIQRIGNITLLTNVTTASGFAAFTLTNSRTLQEFGTIASINIIIIFLFSLLIIPIFFSFSSPPSKRHIQHLDNRWIKSMVKFLAFLVKEKRSLIYYTSTLVVLLALIGLKSVKTTGNFTDDLPKEQRLYKDLKFLEDNFGGVMPLEILVNTKKKNGLFRFSNMSKMNELSQVLSEYPEFSTSSSYIDAIKYTRQAFYNGDSSYYSLPSPQEQRLISSYISNSSSETGIVNLLIDSLKQEARFSLRIADISTEKMDRLLNDLRPRINKIFDKDKYDVTITGISIVFLNGTKFLFQNLILSLLIVIVIISLFMAWMFNSFRMVVISIIPNLIPLIITGSIMGYFGIPLKPSTILVFSIAFGISVDDTIHFLAKYRQELLSSNWDIRSSVFSALEETGVSMFYTSVVLFFGFLVFVLSDFGGTVALGWLVSITLMIAMLSNLLLLPALLLSLEKVINYEAFKDPIIEDL